MTGSIYELAAVWSAWLIGLCFARVKTGRAVLFALVAGVLCAGGSYGLRALDAWVWIEPLYAIVFLAAALSAKVLFKMRWDEVFLSLLLSVGAFAILIIPRYLSEVSATSVGVAAPWLCGGSLILFIGMLLLLYKYFPEKDWQSAFDGKEEQGLKLRRIYMYLLPAIVCLFYFAAGWIPMQGFLSQVIPRVAFESVIYWLTVIVLILMPAYAQKNTAVSAEQEYRAEMQSFMNVIRSQRHDYNFHVQTISGLIRQGKIDECLKYVNALEEDSAIMNAILPVKDPAIAALIHNFQIMAVREGIRLNVDIRYDLSQIVTNVYETNKIISNLLQNAIDETVTHEDKSYGIHLAILKRGEFCVIRVSNAILQTPSKEELGALYQQGYTTKKGHDGVGLSSLKTLVSKYHGAIYTETEDNVIRFVARVPIDYTKEAMEE
ncbi:MAG: GHKL domain-containing protein [Clostridia bacterium]|nr:GHKL domain-containing protein [Clostridia bacterium]